MHYDETRGFGVPAGCVGRGIDPVTGQTVRELYAGSDGSMHREGGLPALWAQDPETGITVEEWYSIRRPGYEDEFCGIRRDRHTGDVINRYGDGGDGLTEQEYAEILERIKSNKLTPKSIHGEQNKLHTAGVSPPSEP